MSLKTTFKGADKKLDTLENIKKAGDRQMKIFGTKTELDLKLSVRNTFSRGKRKRTGHLWRNVKHFLKIASTGSKLAVGTGTSVGASSDVVYARIQDKGGTIHPKSSQYLTIPFPGVYGRARNYANTFFVTSKKGNLILAQSDGVGGLKPLFLLKKSVTLKGTGWFSEVIRKRKPILRGMMKKKVLLELAEKI